MNVITTKRLNEKQLNVYLDRVDSLIMSQLKKGNISQSEALDLQNKAYEFENLSFGMNWLIDYLEEK